MPRAGRVDRPADHRQTAGDGRCAVGLLQPGLEADRRPRRSRDSRDLGGRHRPPGRNAAARSGARTSSAAIFAPDGRTMIASDDYGSVSFVDIRNRTTDPPAAIGRQSACRLAGPQSGRTALGRWLRSKGRCSCGTPKTGAPYGSPLAADTSPGNDVDVQPRRHGPSRARTCVRRSSGTWTESRRSAGRSADRPT